MQTKPLAFRPSSRDSNLMAYLCLAIGVVVWLNLGSILQALRGPGTSADAVENVQQEKPVDKTATIAEKKLPMAGDEYTSMAIRAKGYVLFAEQKDLPLEQLFGRVEDLKYDANGQTDVGRWQRYVIVLGDIAKPEHVAAELAALQKAIDENELYVAKKDELVQEVLIKLYGNKEKNIDMGIQSLSELDLKALETLGWFGELALAPRGTKNTEARAELLRPLQKQAIGLIGGYSIFIGGFLIGLVLLFFYANIRRDQFRIGLDNHGSFAWTFTIWLYLFMVLQVVAPLIAVKINPSASLLGSGAAFFISLIAMAYPVIRGERFARVREFAGLHQGQGFAREALFGLGGYIMAIPLVIAAMFITLLFFTPLTQLSFSGSWAVIEGMLQGDGSLLAAAHPIVLLAMTASTWVKVQILFVACVCAPVVEEIMFRGFLYRNCREMTAHSRERNSIFFSSTMSVLGSTLLSSFIFAVIHPQGLSGIPVLMAMSIGFTLMRQYRDSLVACIVMHAIANGVTLGTVMLMYS